MNYQVNKNETNFQVKFGLINLKKKKRIRENIERTRGRVEESARVESRVVGVQESGVPGEVAANKQTSQRAGRSKQLTQPGVR